MNSYRNNKTGELYEVVFDNAIDANVNDTDIEVSVVYKHVKTCQVYHRKLSYFKEKFTF